MHGGDWASFKKQYGHLPLDFSANISPLGVPESVKQAVIGAAEETDRYPDPFCRKLREEIGKNLKVSSDWILCGNGAADLIWRLAAICRNGKMLLPVPAFSEYRTAVEANGGTVLTYALEDKDDFRITEAFLTALEDTFGCPEEGIKRHPVTDAESSGSVWLCEPGNPSGVRTDYNLLIKILKYCAKAGLMLIVDECFLDLTDDGERYTVKDMLSTYPNLVILRAFTKAYAMAGIRLGYAMCSDLALIEKMRTAGQPWPVSHLAQQAGIAAISDTDYLNRVKKLIRNEREYLRKGLEELGFRVIPGEANYLLFQIRNTDGGHTLSFADIDGKMLSALLKKKGILIRDCSDFQGLKEGWFRIAVRTHEENRLLLCVMTDIYRNKKELMQGGISKENDN